MLFSMAYVRNVGTMMALSIWLAWGAAIIQASESPSADVVTSIAKIAAASKQLEQMYGSFTDPGVLLLVGLNQIFHAQIDDLIPTIALLRLTPSLDFYKLRSCPRADIAKCMYYGNATNGLPKSLQGVFWQDGVILPEQAISTAGVWDPTQRKLSLNVFDSRVWALHDTSSEKKLLGGLLWLPSGAAHYNYIQATAPAVDIYFNEDITFGQILLRITIAYIPITVPLFIANWTMELLPDGSWYRASTTLGVDSSVGFYTLRQAVDGDGKPGPYFNEWLKDQDGAPFRYGEKVFPS